MAGGSHRRSVQLVEVPGKNRHVDSSRLFAPRRSVGQEEAGRGAADSCLRREEDSRWDRR